MARLRPEGSAQAAALVETVTRDRQSTRQTDWAESDLAIIFTALLTGIRAAELRNADIGDIRTTQQGEGVIRVRGKGQKDRSIPIEAGPVTVIEEYLASRASCFPQASSASTANRGLAAWPDNAPLFVGRDGQRITRGTLQSWIRRAFRVAGPDAQPRGCCRVESKFANSRLTLRVILRSPELLCESLPGFAWL